MTRAETEPWLKVWSGAADTRGWIDTLAAWEDGERTASPSAERGLWMSWLWLHTWWEAYGAERLLRVAVLTAGSHRLTCPFYLERRYGRRQLCLVGSASRRHALGAAVPDAPARLAHWLAQRRDWDECKLEAVPDHEHRSWTQGFADAGLALQPGRAWRQRFLPLDRPWTEVEAGFQPGLLCGLARRERGLARAGTVQLRCIVEPAGLQEVFPACLALEASGWKAESGSALAHNPRSEWFYLTLAQRAAEQGQLRLYLLELDAVPIAFNLCLRHDHTLAGLKMGYDRTQRRFAPGLLLLHRLLRAAQAEGITMVDFSGDDDAYKAAWTPHGQRLCDLQVFNRTALGQAARARAFWRQHEAGLARAVTGD